MFGRAQNPNHLPDKDNAVKQEGEGDGRHQRLNTFRDEWWQGISVSKQDDGAQQDQVDKQRMKKRVLALPMIPDIAQPPVP